MQELTLTAGLSVFLTIAMFMLGITTLSQANTAIPKDTVGLGIGAIYMALGAALTVMTYRAIA